MTNRDQVVTFGPETLEWAQSFTELAYSSE